MNRTKTLVYGLISIVITTVIGVTLLQVSKEKAAQAISDSSKYSYVKLSAVYSYRVTERTGSHK